MWDSEMKNCRMLDFAFVVEVNGDEIVQRRDEAGSQEYMAPELENGLYSKRSDLYAFGKMASEIAAYYPKLNDSLKKHIAHLLEPNLEDRPRDLKQFIAHIKDLKQQQGHRVKRAATVAPQYQRDISQKQPSLGTPKIANPNRDRLENKSSNRRRD
jgi:serine/threonine protein kinase